jgi:hypothetical protein
MQEKITKIYKSLGEFKKDQSKMEQQGWVVINQSSHRETFNAGKGCCLGMIFLPLMLFGRGKSSLIVNYERETEEKS